MVVYEYEKMDDFLNKSGKSIFAHERERVVGENEDGKKTIVVDMVFMSLNAEKELHVFAFTVPPEPEMTVELYLTKIKNTFVEQCQVIKSKKPTVEIIRGGIKL